jgi:DNA-3-methyladenine glycosylase
VLLVRRDDAVSCAVEELLAFLKTRQETNIGIDFHESSPRVAKALIGMVILIGGVGGVVVETEAYDESEPASHAFGGPTTRTDVLFGPPGRAYVYLSYGVHWCLNIVCGESGHGAGVLLRALEPTVGVAHMIMRRGTENLRSLCSGPGKLGQALEVTAALNGRRVDRAPFALRRSIENPTIVRGRRIGISAAIERPWRFGLKDSRYLSRPFSGRGI